MKPGAGNVGVPTSRNTPLAKSSRFALKIFNKLFVTKRFKPGILRRAERLSPEAPSHPPPAAGRAPARNGERRCQRRGGGGTRTLPRPRPPPWSQARGPDSGGLCDSARGSKTVPTFKSLFPGPPKAGGGTAGLGVAPPDVLCAPPAGGPRWGAGAPRLPGEATEHRFPSPAVAQGECLPHASPLSPGRRTRAAASLAGPSRPHSQGTGPGHRRERPATSSMR